MRCLALASVRLARQPRRRGPSERAGMACSSWSVVGTFGQQPLVHLAPQARAPRVALLRRVGAKASQRARALRIPLPLNRPKAPRGVERVSRDQLHVHRVSIRGRAHHNTHDGMIGLHCLNHGDTISLIIGGRCADLDQDQKVVARPEDTETFDC